MNGPFSTSERVKVTLIRTGWVGADSERGAVDRMMVHPNTNEWPIHNV